MKGYAIMHLEKQIATIYEDGSCNIFYSQFMPYNLCLEECKDSNPSIQVNNLNNFYYWCASRFLPQDRKYAEELLNSLGIKQPVTDRDRARITISYHALCLTDVFWVREEHETVRYEDINLYAHPLSDAFVSVSLLGYTFTAESSESICQADAAGDLSTLGVAPKAWIRRNHGLILLKAGDLREIEAELVASQITRCFKVDQVLYEPFDYQGQQVSSSRLITSKSRSIVPAEYVSIYADNTDQELEDVVLRHDAYGFHMMNIIDYLIGNTDRHWGNWGFWVINAENRLGALHPLMDFNRAFQSYNTLDGARCLTLRNRTSQKDAAIHGVQCVGLNQIRDLPENLPALFENINKLFNMRLDKMFCARLDLLRKASVTS